MKRRCYWLNFGFTMPETFVVGAVKYTLKGEKVH